MGEMKENEKHIIDSISNISFEEYKSFLSDKFLYDIDFNCQFAIIIGRNNSGKSSLIDIVKVVSQIYDLAKSYKYDDTCEGVKGIKISFYLDLEHLNCGFSSSEFIKDIGKLDQYAKDFIGCKLITSIMPNRLEPIMILGPGSRYNIREDLKKKWINVSRSYFDDMSKIVFRRIDAERDIVPEFESNDIDVDFNGNGLTNIVRMYLNKDELDEFTVETVILRELNAIMGKDAKYTGIKVQQVGSIDENSGKYKWEIFLEENGQRFALSKSGSGLKTIILVLVNLYLIPITKLEYLQRDFVFAFEELENNLHPALQRRLFEYLYRYSLENKVKILLTSHSPVAINAFYGKNKAKIYHVIKNELGSKLMNISCGNEAVDILNDIGAKASDLIQTNGIIWVEGPSDRIYIKRWIEIEVGTDKFIEGQDYQFMFYGGRLIKNLSAKEFDRKEEEDLIKILTINHNAILVMDSDKKESNSRINRTKQRIKRELEDEGCLCWITTGKEIENYIPAEAVNRAYNANLKQIGPFEIYSDYIKKYDHSYANDKVKGARNIVQYIDRSNYDVGLNLKIMIEKIIVKIEKWNSNK